MPQIISKGKGGCTHYGIPEQPSTLCVECAKLFRETYQACIIKRVASIAQNSLKVQCLTDLKQAQINHQTDIEQCNGSCQNCDIPDCDTRLTRYKGENTP